MKTKTLLCFSDVSVCVVVTWRMIKFLKFYRVYIKRNCIHQKLPSLKLTLPPQAGQQCLVVRLVIARQYPMTNREIDNRQADIILKVCCGPHHVKGFA